MLETAGIPYGVYHYSYSNAKLDADNANLASVTVDGVSLTYDAANKIYSGTGTDLQSALMTLVPENLDATITVNGQPYTEAFKQRFSRGSNRFEIVVTALDGTTSATYTFSIEKQDIVHRRWRR